MKLKDCEIVLGTVLDDADPKKLGRVKVGAPGWFDRTTMSIDAIPWVYPFCMSHMQSYSHLAVGTKVWLIINHANEEEFYWLPFHEVLEDTKQAINDDIESDVVISRNNNGSLSQIYSNSTEGIVIRKGPSVCILSTDGSITVKSEDSNGCVKIKGGNVYCGKDGGTMYKMVRGNKLEELLNNLKSNLKQVSELCMGDEHCGKIKPGFEACISGLDTDIPKICTEDVFITES